MVTSLHAREVLVAVGLAHLVPSLERIVVQHCLSAAVQARLVLQLAAVGAALDAERDEPHTVH
jgi:hypothetical protein